MDTDDQLNYRLLVYLGLALDRLPHSLEAQLGRVAKLLHLMLALLQSADGRVTRH